MELVYDGLKVIHIAAAIVAVGSNITYGVWNVRGMRETAHLAFALKGVKFLDDRIANPAYGVLFVTGLILVFVGHWRLTSLWILVAIVLLLAIAVLGFLVFSPQLKRQIELAEAGQTSSAEFARLGSMSRTIGPVLGLAIVVILVMMVFKPSL